MSGASARDGRRRRVLQEEVLSASREMPAYTGDDPVESGEGRRYAITPDSLGAALARRHFPTKIVLPVGMIVGATLLTAGLVALDLHASQLDARLGNSGQTVAQLGAPGSLGKWASSTSLMMAAIAGGMILAVRRQRVDDYRGKYRLWRSAIALLAVASLVVGTGLHHAFAAMMTEVTGTSLFGGGAGWWLLTGGALSGLVALRVFLDVRESRFAAVSLGVGIGSLALSLMGLTGWLADGSTADSILKGLAVWGYLMIPTALVAYMRFLRHDVAAGVATRLRVARPQEATSRTAKPKTSSPDTISIAEHSQQQPAAKRAKEKKPNKQANQAAASRWTDGSDGIPDEYQDEEFGQGRKLNKADRKRLRRQKEERWAA